MKSILMALALLPFPCMAAESPPEPPAQATSTLADLLREAEESNPAVRSAEARLEAARRVPIRTEAPPDPEIGLTYVNDGVSSFTLGESEFASLGLTWSQELPSRAKRKRAGAVAEADVDLAAAELRRTRLDVRAAVVQACAELYRLDQAASILRETSAILKTLASAARSRYEVGSGVQENVLKAETEVLRLEAENARLEEDRTAVLARLAALLGRQGNMMMAAIGDLPDVQVPADVDDIESEAAAASAAAEASRAGVRRGETAVEAARFESKPELRWSAGYQYRGDLDPMVMGMIGFRLPIYHDRKQVEEVVEAEARLSAARHDLAETELKTRADARAIWARAKRADRLVELYEKGVIVQARAALASAQASYGVGRIEFLDLLNDLTVLLMARLEAAAQASERMQAMAALEAVTGRDLIGIVMPQPGSTERP